MSKRFTMRTVALGIALTAARVDGAQGPSFDCAGVADGSIEAMVCTDPTLAALDRTLAGVYASASAKAINEHPPTLKVEQRGWVKGRNDCWKSSDQPACIADAYRRRIAELQARYRLVPENGPHAYACESTGDEIVVTFFETDPPTLIAERGDSVSLMYLEAGASGAKYVGRNESLWDHHGEALVTWGYGASEMKCVARRPPG